MLTERQVRARDGTMRGRRPPPVAVTDMAGVLNGHPRSNFSNPDLSSQAIETASIFPDLSYSVATYHHPDAFGGSIYQPVCTLICKLTCAVKFSDKDEDDPSKAVCDPQFRVWGFRIMIQGKARFRCRW